MSELIDTKPRKATCLTPTMVLNCIIINPCSFDNPVYRCNIGMSQSSYIRIYVIKLYWILPNNLWYWQWNYTQLEVRVKNSKTWKLYSLQKITPKEYSLYIATKMPLRVFHWTLWLWGQHVHKPREAERKHSEKLNWHFKYRMRNMSRILNEKQQNYNYAHQDQLLVAIY